MNLLGNPHGRGRGEGDPHKSTLSVIEPVCRERTDKGKKLASSHAMHFVIHDQPNVDSTASVFWEAMIAAMLLRGAGRAEKLMIGNKVVGLTFLDPEKLSISADGNRLAVGAPWEDRDGEAGGRTRV